jgi:hypothetical protein
MKVLYSHPISSVLDMNSYRLIRGKVMSVIDDTFVANNLYRLPSTYA